MSDGKLNKVKATFTKYLSTILQLVYCLSFLVFCEVIIHTFKTGFSVMNVSSIICAGGIFYILYKGYLRVRGIDGYEYSKEINKAIRKRSSIVIPILIHSGGKIVYVGMPVVCISLFSLLIVGAIFGDVLLELISLETIYSDVVVIMMDKIMLISIACLGYLAATMHIRFNQSYVIVGNLFRFVYACGIMCSMVLCVIKMPSIMKEVYASYETILVTLTVLILTFTMYNVAMGLYRQDSLFGEMESKENTRKGNE